jgi:hypothetical protein
MASYMDIFKRDPLAPASTIKEKPLPQMNRPAPAFKPPKPEESMVDKAKDMLAEKAVSSAAESAESYIKSDILPGMKTKLGEMFGANQAATAAAPMVSGTQAAALQSAASTGSLNPGIVNAVLGTGAATPAAASTAAGTAAAGTAGAGAMAGLATAMPYIGIGLLAGKAFGLFNQGGPVSAMQEEPKELLGPLAIRKIRYKQDGGKIEVEATMGD